jgi:hypothetical protein
MWLDVFTPEKGKYMPLINIKPPPPEPFVLRVIVWGVRDVPILDEVSRCFRPEQLHLASSAY